MHKHILKPRKLLRRLGLRAGHRVGDFGAGGSGTFTIPAARMVDRKGKVFAFDIRDRALSALEGKARLFNVRNIDSVLSDIEKASLYTDEHHGLDHALLVNVLHQGKGQEKILQNILRLLHQGGKLLIINYTPEGAEMLIGAEAYSQAECRNLIQQQNWDIIEELDDLGDFYYGYVLRKK